GTHNSDHSRSTGGNKPRKLEGQALDMPTAWPVGSFHQRIPLVILLALPGALVSTPAVSVTRAVDRAGGCITMCCSDHVASHGGLVDRCRNIFGDGQAISSNPGKLVSAWVVAITKPWEATVTAATCLGERVSTSDIRQDPWRSFQFLDMTACPQSLMIPEVSSSKNRSAQFVDH